MKNLPLICLALLALVALPALATAPDGATAPATGDNGSSQPGDTEAEAQPAPAQDLLTEVDPLSGALEVYSCNFHSDCVDYCEANYGPFAEAACIEGSCHCCLP